MRFDSCQKVIFPENLEQQLNKAALLVRSSQNCIAFTGAGISVPSGVPDFRSVSTGLWNRFDPMAVASLSAFRYRPAAFFGWLAPLVNQILSSIPNPAHYALAELQAAGYIQTVITQNIDGFHQKAGSSDVIELHGNLNEFVCPGCHARQKLIDFQDAWLEKHHLPLCPHCNMHLKPDIVLYEEILPDNAWEQAEFACTHADLMLVVGTSLEVMPAASLPYQGLRNGAKLIIMNLSATPLDHLADVVLPLDIAASLPELCRRVLV
ncbi:MAG TPA: NAD-dependent deacylase [Leptolinea sp.]